jgi:hypothetical protein
MKRMILGLVASLATASVLAQTAPQAAPAPANPQTQEAPATAANAKSSQPTTMSEPVPKRKKNREAVAAWGTVGAVAALLLAVGGGGGGSDHASSP